VNNFIGIKYYLGGMQEPLRKYSSTSQYRYGFNGKEKSDEIVVGDLDFGARIYDGRIGRWLSTEPLFKNYVEFSPYCFGLNTPVHAKDHDGNLVIFINGQHSGDGGRSQYWGEVDKQIMNKIGDHKAMYFDGASGGWTNTGTHATMGAYEGQKFGSIGGLGGKFLGGLIGAGISVVNSSNVNYENRIKAGAAMGNQQAATIFANLKIGESIKIVTHSMGTAYARGFTESLQKYYDSHKSELQKKGITLKFSYELDVNAFNGSNPALAKPKNIGYLEYISGTSDWIANAQAASGTGLSWLSNSNISGANKQLTANGGGHSITDNIIKSAISSSTAMKNIGTTDQNFTNEKNKTVQGGNKPIYEENPKKQ